MPFVSRHSVSVIGIAISSLFGLRLTDSAEGNKEEEGESKGCWVVEQGSPVISAGKDKYDVVVLRLVRSS